MVLKICHLESCQLPMATDVHLYFLHMGNRSHSAWLPINKINLLWVFCFDHLDPVCVEDFSVDEVFCCS